jgi:hypothetical protein
VSLIWVLVILLKYTVTEARYKNFLAGKLISINAKRLQRLMDLTHGELTPEF